MLELPTLNTPKYDERMPALSGDGRWLAYTSDETGRAEVHVRGFRSGESGGESDGSSHLQLSSDGGSEPVWRGDGRELLRSIASFVASGSWGVVVIGRPVRPQPRFFGNRNETTNRTWCPGAPFGRVAFA